MRGGPARKESALSYGYQTMFHNISYANSPFGGKTRHVPGPRRLVLPLSRSRTTAPGRQEVPRLGSGDDQTIRSLASIDAALLNVMTSCDVPPA